MTPEPNIHNDEQPCFGGAIAARTVLEIYQTIRPFVPQGVSIRRSFGEGEL